MNVMRADYRTIKSSDHERVKQVEDEFDRDARAHQNGLSRMYEAWDVYWSVNGSGWEKKKLNELREANRHVPSFNICAPKVDTLAGTIVSDLPDSDWVPTEGPRTTTTEAIRETYRSDKEMCNWERALISVIRDGLVHEGWYRMVETKRFSPRGNLGIERIQPGFFIPGSGWKTDDDWDLKNCYVIGFMPPEGIAFKYQAKSDEIRRAVEERKRNKQEMPTNAGRLRQMFERRVGDEYMIIENHWLEMVRRKRLIGQRRGTNYWLPFPLTDDRDACIAFAEANDIDLSTAYPDDYEDQIHHVTTIVPELDPRLLLENGKSKMQTKMLPFGHFTVTRYNGESKGIVAEIMDTQRTIAERITMESAAIENAAGGADLWNRNLFTDENDWREFKKNKNKFGWAGRADLDDVTKIREAITDQTRLSNLRDQLSVLWEGVLPLVSRVSDSMSAITDSSKSGILFEREYQINRIGNLLMDKAVKHMVNNIGEQYFWQWQILYKGEPREVSTEDGGRIVLNERIPAGIGADGQIQYAIRNAVEFTPRCRVVITENVKSSTQQMYRRHILREMLEALQKNPEVNMAQIQATYGLFLDNIDIGDDKGRSALESAGMLDQMRTQTKILSDLIALRAQMKGATVQAMQYDNLIAQMMQKMAMGGGGGGGAGAPVKESLTGPGQMVRGGGQMQSQPAPVQGEQPVGQLPPPPGRSGENVGDSTPEGGV